MPNLQCPVLNFGYEWALKWIPRPPCRLLDIGCRTSGFPAWAAHLGYDVVACDSSPIAATHQTRWGERFDVQFRFRYADVRDIEDTFDVATSFCALQHCEDDIAAYAHVARITTQCIFIMTECGPEGRRQYNRDDGPLRVYSFEELETRIMSPIFRVWSDFRLVKRVPLEFSHERQTIRPLASWGPDVNMAFLLFERRAASDVSQLGL